jgi:hypothetical protein
MKKRIVFAAAAFFTLFLFSCGGSKALVNSKESHIVLVILETIPATNAPEWVNNTAEFWEENGNYYYRGFSEGMTNVEATRRAAQASANTQIAEQVKSVVRVEFSRALEGAAYDANVGAYLKDIFFSVVDNLNVSGATLRESYTQRLSERNTETGNSRIYCRSYALVQISAADYKRLVAGAFSKTQDQVKANESAKELSQKVEERFFNSQNAE